MSEKVLTTEVIKLRRKRAEERDKAKENAQNNVDTLETPATPETPAPAPKPQMFVAPKSPLEQNYYNLLQLVVRYGERPMEVEGTIYTVGEIIIYTLEGDEIKPPQPVYQTIIDEFKRHCKDTNFRAESFYKFHPDPAVSALAVDMIAEKYQTAAPKDDARLGELVTQLLYEMKLTVINMQIAELEAGLKDAQEKNDVERQRLLLQHHPQLLAQRNEICKLLGNRIINL